MTNLAILVSRVRLLKDDLEGLLQRLQDLTADFESYGGDDSRMELAEQASARLADAETLLTDMTQPAAQPDWNRFDDVRSEAIKLHQAILEAVQGLAIHKAQSNSSACRIVRKFLEHIWPRDLGLTVFTARDLNFPPLARLTRVRFPVKSIWTFPLAAHYFANLQISGSDKLRALLQSLAATDAASADRWMQLMSDALAVYFSGPSYAGATILLRLLPSAGAEEPWQAAPGERAFVMLEMLRQMEPGPAAPYQQFIDWLQTHWNAMLAAEKVSPLDEPRQTSLRAMVAKLMANRDFAAKKYPSILARQMNTTGSWSMAQQWSQDWLADLKGGSGNLRTPAVDGLSNLRDAFNAGWDCWSKSGDIESYKFNALGGAVLAACEAILEQKEKLADSNDPQRRASARAKA